MQKPVLFTVDDSPEVLRAVERDLRRKYGKEYRVMRSSSGAAALDALAQLKLREQPVALFLVDQIMPEMTGVQFLEQAMRVFPDAKKVLLTAYADTEAAIQAINTVKVDYYLMKPWDPPEEHLYPLLDDFLEDWIADYRPAFDGIRVVGNRWSAKSHDVKDFLAGNQVRFLWMDVESNQEARRLVQYVEGDVAKLPVVIFPEGDTLIQPTNLQIAEKIGLSTRAKQKFYDLVIVGGGPAGLAAAVYGASEGLKTVLIERDAPGGQAGTSSRIENYLGFPTGLSGGDLARRAVTQARRFGVEILSPQEVCGMRVEDPYRYVALGDGTEISCSAMLISTGVSYRKLNVPGMDTLTGAGAYYGAAMTEAISCQDEGVYIIGAANSAGQAAVYFARYAREVTILCRGAGIASGMSQYLVDQIEETPNIRVLNYTNVVEVRGKDNLDEIVIKNSETGETQSVPAAALFIFIGAEPRTEWLGGIVERDEKGFILSGADLLREGKRPKGWKPARDPYLLETSVPGVFVAGDVRHRSVKRVASGVGEGSIAVQFIHQYLSQVQA